MSQKQLFGIAFIILSVMVGLKMRTQGRLGLPARSDKSHPSSQSGQQHTLGNLRGSEAEAPGAPSHGAEAIGSQAEGAGQKAVAITPSMLSFASDSARSTFLRRAGLSAQLPGGMQFSRLDLDPGMAGIVGKNLAEKTSMSVIGYNRIVPPSSVAQFIKSGDTGIPNLEGAIPSSFTRSTTVEAIPHSGLGAAVVMHGKNARGEAVHVAFAPREDQKGMYMFVVTGPPSFFETNDGLFEQMYQNLKAQEPVEIERPQIKRK